MQNLHGLRSVCLALLHVGFVYILHLNNSNTELKQEIYCLRDLGCDGTSSAPVTDKWKTIILSRIFTNLLKIIFSLKWIYMRKDSVAEPKLFF